MDFDKAGAEWVIVAYLANDANMLQVVRSGESPHVATGHLITGAPKYLIELEDKLLGKTTDPDELFRMREANEELRPLLALPFIPRSMTIRQGGKKSNHGLNYGMKYRRFALENEIPETDADRIVNLYTTAAYPGIPENFWKPTVEQLRKDRTLTNCFGRKVRLLGEWGVELFDKAYSFVPQSTVGDTVNRAIRDAYADQAPTFRAAEILSQKHDSATWQYPLKDLKAMADFAIQFGLDHMNPMLQYGEHQFQIGTDLKVGFDMGEKSMVKIKLSRDIENVAVQLEQAIEQLASRGQAYSDSLEAVSPPAQEEQAPEWEGVPEVQEAAAA